MTEFKKRLLIASPDTPPSSEDIQPLARHQKLQEVMEYALFKVLCTESIYAGIDPGLIYLNGTLRCHEVIAVPDDLNDFLHELKPPLDSIRSSLQDILVSYRDWLQDHDQRMDKTKFVLVIYYNLLIGNTLIVSASLARR